MTVKKLVWTNPSGGKRLIAVKTSNDDMQHFHEAYPVMPEHGAEWLTLENQKIFLARQKVDRDGKKQTFDELIYESLKERFAKQSKNPEWIKEYLDGEEITTDKNGSQVDPRLLGVYYAGQDADSLETQIATNEPVGPVVTLDDLQDFNVDELVELCVKLDVIGWSSREGKDKLIDRVSKHLGLNKEDKKDKETKDKEEDKN